MHAPRLILTILLPMIAGAAAGAIHRGGFFGGYNGMVAGLIIGIIAAAFVFLGDAMFNRQQRLAPVFTWAFAAVVGVLAAVFAFVGVRMAFDPPAEVIFGQTFGYETPESVENIRGRVVYADREMAILLRFQVPPDDLPRLLEHRDLQPQPSDAPAPELEPFDLPGWWDLADPHDPGLQRYHTEVDYAASADGESPDGPAPPEEHTPAAEYFASPGQLFYDPQNHTAWFVDRSYWTAPESEEPVDTQ